MLSSVVVCGVLLFMMFFVIMFVCVRNLYMLCLVIVMFVVVDVLLLFSLVDMNILLVFLVVLL